MMKIFTWEDCPNFKFDESKYKYQVNLGNKLKDSTVKNVSQEWINEVVLWKVNRYAEVSSSTLRILEDERIFLDEIDVNFAKEVLSNLLQESGIRLPMASTVLRFRNPNVYQIIDQRAYRVAFGKEKMLQQNTHAA
ncbi:MAG: hypothetical protein ABI415_04790 [Flavitalea sp.]